MNEKEQMEFLAMLKKESEKTPTKEEADAFLKRMGFLTKKGKIAKPYRNICFTPVQA